MSNGVALVTGGSRASHAVVFSYHSGAEAAQRVADSVREEGGSATAVRARISGCLG